MYYKYAPIYKYGLLFLVVYMFMRHQKIMNYDTLLINTTMIVLVMFIFDSILIFDHPSLLEETHKKKHKNSNSEITITDDELDDIINSFDVNIDEEPNDNIQVNVNPRYNNFNNNTRKRFYDTTMI